MKLGSQIFGLLGVALLLFFFAEMRPGYFSDITYLGGFLLLEVILVSVWHYEKWFFAILMLIFLWAGSSLPMSGAAQALRWVFLMVGGFVGMVRWGARSERRSFSAVHLIASLCVVSALVSVLVSSRTQVALLKSASLFLLFLYASSGARVAAAAGDGAFFRRLVAACEVLSFLSAFLYIGLGFELFGNPNSLGALMGVAIVPILAWGFLISEDRQVRARRAIALFVAGYLLFSSVSRAGLLACGVTLALTCLALRRGSLLLKGGFILAFLVTAVGVLRPTHFDSMVSSFTEQIIYKGKMEEGLFGSRRSPWNDTVAVIKESPWFGSGFGTDSVQGPILSESMFHTELVNREHGSSYMALLQYVGLLGAIPFVILLGFIAWQLYRTFSWIRRTSDPHNYALPLAMVCLSGLIHAAFEDWLIAPGYYLTLLFWISAFLLSDFLPRRAGELAFVDARHGPASTDSPVAALAAK
jgi:O-antigen ligase